MMKQQCRESLPQHNHCSPYEYKVRRLRLAAGVCKSCKGRVQADCSLVNIEPHPHHPTLCVCTMHVLYLFVCTMYVMCPYTMQYCCRGAIYLDGQAVFAKMAVLRLCRLQGTASLCQRQTCPEAELRWRGHHDVACRKQ